MANGAAPVLDVRGLKTVFHTRQGEIHAVSAVNLSLKRGEVLGVVGESGSGKFGRGRGYYHGVGSVLFGPWLSARFSNMGPIIVRWVELSPTLPRTCDLAWPCNLADGLVSQLHRRWFARCIGPTD